MIRIIWDQNELENEISRKDFRIGNLDELNLDLKLYLTDTSYFGEFYTFARYFFSSIFSTFQYLDPKRLGDKKLDFEPSQEPWIVNVDLYFSLDEENDMLIIEYPQYIENPPLFDLNDPNININELRQKRLPFKEFIEGVIESVELFMKQIIEIRPDLENDYAFGGKVIVSSDLKNSCLELVGLKRELEIIKEWYWKKYRIS